MKVANDTPLFIYYAFWPILLLGHSASKQKEGFTRRKLTNFAYFCWQLEDQSIHLNPKRICLIGVPAAAYQCLFIHLSHHFMTSNKDIG